MGRYQHHYLTAGPVADMDLRICGTLYHRRIRNQRTLVREFIPGPAREMPPVQVRQCCCACLLWGRSSLLVQTEIVDFLIWREAEDIRLAELAAAEAGASGFQAFVACACLWVSHCAHPTERLRLIAEEEARIVRSHTHTHTYTHTHPHTC